MTLLWDLTRDIEKARVRLGDTEREIERQEEQSIRAGEILEEAQIEEARLDNANRITLCTGFTLAATAAVLAIWSGPVAMVWVTGLLSPVVLFFTIWHRISANEGGLAHARKQTRRLSRDRDRQQRKVWTLLERRQLLLKQIELDEETLRNMTDATPERTRELFELRNRTQLELMRSLAHSYSDEKSRAELDVLRSMAEKIRNP